MLINTLAPGTFQPFKPYSGYSSQNKAAADGILILAPASPSIWRRPNCVVTRAAANSAAAMRA
jgi:hypothetical protein